MSSTVPAIVSFVHLDQGSFFFFFLIHLSSSLVWIVLLWTLSLVLFTPPGFHLVDLYTHNCLEKGINKREIVQSEKLFLYFRDYFIDFFQAWNTLNNIFKPFQIKMLLSVSFILQALINILLCKCAVKPTWNEKHLNHVSLCITPDFDYSFTLLWHFLFVFSCVYIYIYDASFHCLPDLLPGCSYFHLRENKDFFSSFFAESFNINYDYCNHRETAKQCIVSMEKLHLIVLMFLPPVPASEVHPLLQQFNWSLSAVAPQHWCISVISEVDKTLIYWRHIHHFSWHTGTDIIQMVSHKYMEYCK